MTKVVPWAVAGGGGTVAPGAGSRWRRRRPRKRRQDPAVPPSAVVASIRNAAESIQVISRRGPRTGPRDIPRSGAVGSTCFKRFARITGPIRWLGCRSETGRASAFAPGVGGFDPLFGTGQPLHVRLGCCEREIPKRVGSRIKLWPSREMAIGCAPSPRPRTRRDRDLNPVCSGRNSGTPLPLVRTTPEFEQPSSRSPRTIALPIPNQPGNRERGGGRRSRYRRYAERARDCAVPLERVGDGLEARKYARLRRCRRARSGSGPIELLRFHSADWNPDEICCMTLGGIEGGDAG